MSGKIPYFKQGDPDQILIDEFAPGICLFRDARTGIAWVTDGRSGCKHSAHPNISDRGNVTGMEAKGWWPKGTRTARSHGYIYNIDQVVGSDELDEIAGRFCECFGCIGRKASATKERTTLLLQGARDALDLGIAGRASIEDFAKARAAIEAWLEGRHG